MRTLRIATLFTLSLILASVTGHPSHAADQTLPIDPGFNFVTLDVTVSPPLTTSSLMTAHQEIDSIFVFDKTSQSFQYQLRLPGGTLFGADFPLEPGQGHVIKANASFSLSVSGSPFEDDPLPSLAPGFNFTGMKRHAGTMAKALLDARTDIASVFRWDASLSAFGFVLRLPTGALFGEDFPFEAGKGYFVKGTTGGVTPPPQPLSLEFSPPALVLNVGTVFDLTTIGVAARLSDGGTISVTGVEWILSSGPGSLSANVYSASTMGEASLTASVTLNGSYLQAVLPVTIMPAFQEVTATTAAPTVQETVIDNTSVKLEVSAGTFDTDTKIVLSTPDSAVTPAFMPEAVQKVDTEIGLTFDSKPAAEDLYVEMDIPASIPDDMLVVTFYDGERHIPLEVVQSVSSPSGSPGRAVARSAIGGAVKRIRVRISSAVVNDYMKAKSAVQAMAVEVKSGAIAMADTVKDGVISIGKTVKTVAESIEDAFRVPPVNELWTYDSAWRKVMTSSESVAERASGFAVDPGRRTVVVVHGILSEVANFVELGAALRSQGFNVIGYTYNFRDDIRVNGRDLNAQLAGIKANLGQKVHVVAHSMGGLVARWAVKEGSDANVERLVLLSTPNAGARGAINLTSWLVVYKIPPLGMLTLYPNGLGQLLSSTPVGISFYSDLNTNWRTVATEYFGIIHENDEVVSRESWGIFKTPGIHEIAANGAWTWDKTGDFDNERIKIITTTDFDDSLLNPADAHGASHTQTVAHDKISIFLGDPVIPSVATPVISPSTNTYTTAQSVSITCATSGATIRYTLNGTTPSATNGLTYSGSPFTVSTTTTVKAIGIKSGMLDSAVATATYTIQIQNPGDGEGSYAGELRTIDLGGGVTMNFRWCPAGSFQMGSPDTEPDRYSDEGPVHTVTLAKGFWLAETECTQAQWLAVKGSWPGTAPSSSYGVGNDHPAYYVSWNDIAGTGGFMETLNGKGLGVGTFRLPTEAEWEYACRAGSSTAFYWGAAMDGAYCWYWDNNTPYGTKPVKGRTPNAWNLYDMSGNVWEWCGDWYGSTYYSGGAMTDPQGPTSGSHRVLRGGSWDSDAGYCRSANRDGGAPSFRGSSVGFRPLLAPGQ